MPHTYKDHFQAHPKNWTAASLAELSLKELQALATLAGMPTSGTKASLSARILKIVRVRIVISTWGDTPQDIHNLAAERDRKTLRAYCDVAGTWIAPTKPGMVAALLNWRNEARRRGQANLREAQAQVQQARAARPQLCLFGREASND